MAFLVIICTPFHARTRNSRCHFHLEIITGEILSQIEVFVIVDFENAFDQVLWVFIWLALRKLGMDKWLVRHVQAMYKNVPSQVRVNGSFSDDFLQQVNFN